MKMEEIIAKIIERFNKHWIPEPNSGCWLWTASLNRRGYAQFNSTGDMVEAHRFIYRMTYGEVPKGLVLDHKCNVRSCVNPDHLKPSTQRDNILRGNGMSARNARKTHCFRGHEFTEDNIYWSKEGRRCRLCNLEWRGLDYKKERRNAKQKGDAEI